MTPMNAVQSALSSPRFSRILFWFGAAVLAAGLAVLIVKLASRGSSHPAAVHKPIPAQLPGRSAKEQQLLNQSTIKSYAKVDPVAKHSLNTFILSAVPRHHLAASFALAAPVMRQGYTLKKWKKGTLPVLYYPLYKFPGGAIYRLVYGTSTDLLVDVKVFSPPKQNMRPLTMRVGLKRFGTGDDRRWLVNYIQPVYTPLLPIDQ